MKEYAISDHYGTRAEIPPEKGATVVSLQRNGVEFRYRDDKKLNSPVRRPLSLSYFGVG